MLEYQSFPCGIAWQLFQGLGTKGQIKTGAGFLLDNLRRSKASAICLQIAPLQTLHIGETEAAQTSKEKGLLHLGMAIQRSSCQTSDFLNDQIGFPGFGTTRTVLGTEIVHGITK